MGCYLKRCFGNYNLNYFASKHELDFNFGNGNFCSYYLVDAKDYGKKTSSAMDKVNKKNDKLLNTIEHWLGGLQELRRYSAYSRLIKQLNRASNDYVETGKKSF